MENYEDEETIENENDDVVASVLDGNLLIRKGDVFANWQIPETENHKKSKRWFIVAGIIFIGLIVQALYTQNFYFAIIMIIVAMIIIIKDSQEINLIDILLTHNGIKLGKKFYDFDIIKSFSIIYKPEQEKKLLIFEFKNAIRPGMYIPITEINPLIIRENLLKYIQEDLERDDIPTADSINRLLKL